jgi:TetR/AcrR family transcriptional regulator, fatty acid metabolism regulator protein
MMRRNVLEGLQGDFSPKEVHLIRSAYRVIGEKGVHGFSLQDVADAAWVSKGVILYHFKSKENLILATMRWVLSTVAERIHRSLARARTPEDRILAMIDTIFTDAEANRNFYLAYLDLAGDAARVPIFAELNATFHGIVNALYSEVIRLGVDNGAFQTDDLEEAALVLRAIIDGLFIQWVQELDWRSTHAHYRETCKRAALAYLRSGLVVSA